MKQSQEVVLRDQIDEVLEVKRNCGNCGKRRVFHDDRGRNLDTLCGRFRISAPRLRRYDSFWCIINRVAFTVCGAFTGCATPELQRLQAEFGSRHSSREVARLMKIFCPVHSSRTRRYATVWDALPKNWKQCKRRNATQTQCPDRLHPPFSWTAHPSDAARNTRSATSMLWSARSKTTTRADALVLCNKPRSFQPGNYEII